MNNEVKKMNQEEIDWSKFEDRYVRFETDVEKRLKLSNWRLGIWFGKPGLSFVVTEEDNVPVSKQFTTASRKLVSILRPIIQKAKEKGLDYVRVSIIRMGEGFETSYAVKELAPFAEEVINDE